MNMQFFEQMSDFNRNLYKPLTQLNQFAAQSAEAYARLSINAGNDFFNVCTNYAQNLPSIKKPEDIVNLQTNFLNEWASKCMSNFNQLFEAQQNLSSEYINIFQKNFKNLSEEAAARAKSATKQV